VYFREKKHTAHAKKRKKKKKTPLIKKKQQRAGIKPSTSYLGRATLGSLPRSGWQSQYNAPITVFINGKHEKHP
jgi:hypothetical protein